MFGKRDTEAWWLVTHREYDVDSFLASDSPRWIQVFRLPIYPEFTVRIAIALLG
jgi:hypothetical protein